MSNPIPVAQIKKALQEKGFTPVDDRDHTFYYFYYKGKKTKVRTKISRGSAYKDYDDELFGKMKSQLCLDNVKQVRDLLECPMSEKTYIAELQKKGLLDD